MDEGQEFESREDLIAFARANGYEVEDRLARWHRSGLLPTPIQRSKGKGRGTTSLYPVGTHRQLLALLRIHQDEGEKRLPFVAWRLWWDGFEIPMERIRSFLEGAARSFERTPIPKWSEKVLSYVETHRLPSPLGRARQHSKSDFPTTARVVLRIARGRFSDFEDDDERDAVEGTLGLPEQERAIRLVGETPTPRDTRRTLVLVSRAFANKGMSRALVKSSDETLLAVRQELHDLIEMLRSLGAASRWVLADKAYPYALLGRAVGAIGPRMQAGWLLVITALREDPDIKEGLATLLGAKEGWDQGYRSWLLLQAMGREIPATAATLSPERFRAAFRNPDSMKRLQEEIRRLRAAHLKEFQQFFARHEVPTWTEEEDEVTEKT